MPRGGIGRRWNLRDVARRQIAINKLKMGGLSNAEVATELRIPIYTVDKYALILRKQARGKYKSPKYLQRALFALRRRGFRADAIRQNKVFELRNSGMSGVEIAKVLHTHPDKIMLDLRLLRNSVRAELLKAMFSPWNPMPKILKEHWARLRAGVIKEINGRGLIQSMEKVRDEGWRRIMATRRTPADEAVEAERARIVSEAVGNLSQAEQRVLVGRFIESKTNSEIGTELKLTPEEVETILSMALKKLANDRRLRSLL